MTFLIICISLIAVIFGALFLHYYFRKVVVEGYDQPFSLISDNISDGNPASISGRPNPYVDINIRGQPDPVIYQGHGVPLLHEDHPTRPATTKMLYFQDYSVKPECCTYSPFSSSTGCVCWQAPPQAGIEQNISISPRS